MFPSDRGVNIFRGKGARGKMIPRLTGEELHGIIKRTSRKGKKAPGPDGIQGKLVAEAQLVAEVEYRGLYDGCLRTGMFPYRWKTAKLVLLKKEGKPDGEASSYRGCLPVLVE